MINEFEDSFLDELLENLDDFLDDKSEETSPSREARPSGSDTSSGDEHTGFIPHVIYVRKRPYKRRQIQRRHGQAVTLPRRIRNDIRLSYAQMYANVMNSYDHPLMTSFFQKFFVPESKMTKLPTTVTAPRAEITGSDLLACYFLVLAQSAPDYATAVFNVRLKPKSKDSEAELSCIVRVSHTLFYDIKPGALAKAVLDEYYNSPSVLESSDAEGSRKRKISSDIDSLLRSLKRNTKLLDPVSGSFCETKFPRLPNPIPFTGDFVMKMKINDEKQITQLIYGPIELIPSPGNLCKYY